MNKTDEIKNLLNKYFDGDSTLFEENILRKYFIDIDNVKSEFKAYASLFNYISDERKNSGTEDRIICNKKKFLRLGIISIISVAALVLFFFSFSVNKSESSDILFAHYINGVQVEDVDAGMNEASDIINSVSKNISGILSKVPRQTPLNTINDNLKKMKYEEIINFYF